jgi:hypothetical protein
VVLEPEQSRIRHRRRQRPGLVEQVRLSDNHDMVCTLEKGVQVVSIHQFGLLLLFFGSS